MGGEMKLSIDEDYTIVLKEVFNSIVLETEEGNRFAICMRDDTVEMTVAGSGIWYRADMKTGKIDNEEINLTDFPTKGDNFTTEFKTVNQQVDFPVTDGGLD
jgi:hypothetical protein